MNTIEKISDLKIGEYYFLCFVQSEKLAKKCKLIAIINENVQYSDNEITELYVEFKNTTHLVFCQEIGIGNTKIQAKNNFGKFKYEHNDSFSNSYDKVLEEWKGFS